MKQNVKRSKAGRRARTKVKRRVRISLPRAHRTRRPKQPMKPRAVTDPEAPRTVLNDIDWDAVHVQVDQHVKAILKSRPRPLLPRGGWNEKKIVSALGLRVAGVLLSRPVDSQVPIENVVETEATRLFSTFLAMVQAEACDAFALEEAMRARLCRQQGGAHRAVETVPARKTKPRTRDQGC